MKKILALFLLALATALFNTGCVVGRRTIDLPVTAMAAPVNITKGDIAITSVTDNREFVNKPSDPSTPSIDGDVTTLSPDQKDFMIGRQRNGYGKAMGDIALVAGQSVTKKTRLLLEQGLQSHGYRLSSDPAAATTVDVSIDEFWAWFTPGMWTVTFNSRVYCTLTMKKAGSSATLVVKGSGTNVGQIASDANWALAYDRAFKDFLEKIGPQLNKAGY